MQRQLICSTRLVLSFLFAWGLGAGCASSPVVPVKPEEFSRRERALGEVFSADLNQLLRSKKDVELDVYLRRELVRIVEAAGGRLAESPLGIQLYKDPAGRQSSYSVPGLRIWISTDALKALRYESELAALLALEVSNVEKGLFLRRVSTLVGDPAEVDRFSLQWTPEELRKALPAAPNYLGPGGLFDFAREEKIAALKRAVSILYDSGFDPRGILSLLERWKAAGPKSPWPAEEIEDVREDLRAELNRFPPLRNPVVRSEEFVKILKRIERL